MMSLLTHNKKKMRCGKTDVSMCWRSCEEQEHTPPHEHHNLYSSFRSFILRRLAMSIMSVSLRWKLFGRHLRCRTSGSMLRILAYQDVLITLGGRFLKDGKQFAGEDERAEDTAKYKCR